MRHAESTVAVARRSLGHFALGRTLSAIVGFTTLLLLVRTLGRDDYGLYIALLGGFEVVQVAATPGAHAAASRFLPELRDQRAGRALALFVTALSGYGLLMLALAAALLAGTAQSLAALLASPGQAAALRLFAFVVVFEGTARLIDLQFESLLEQGLAQLSVLLRSTLRLIALAWLGALGAHEVPLASWVAVEAATTAAGLVSALGLMARHVRGRLSGSDALAIVPALALGRVWRFAAPTWLAHLLGVGSGVEMAKLLAGRLAGTAAAAPFGFAAVLAGAVQRYLPSYLLLGWIRPLLISEREAGRPLDALAARAATIVKLNLLVIAPLACLLMVAGPQLVALLGGGRLPESLPYVAFFVGLLIVRSVNTAVSLLGAAMELGAANLRAMLVAVAGMALGVSAFPWLGMWAICLGLLVGETLWTLTMARALHLVGMRLALPWPSVARLAASVLVPAALARLWLTAAPSPGASTATTALVAGVSAALACLLLAAALRPFASGERDLINRLLPAPLFIW